MLAFLISFPTWFILFTASAYRIFIENELTPVTRIFFIGSCIYPFFLPFFIFSIDKLIMIQYNIFIKTREEKKQ